MLFRSHGRSCNLCGPTAVVRRGLDDGGGGIAERVGRCLFVLQAGLDGRVDLGKEVRVQHGGVQRLEVALDGEEGFDDRPSVRRLPGGLEERAEAVVDARLPVLDSQSCAWRRTIAAR